MVRKISGKISGNHPLQVDNNEVSDIPGIANSLAHAFSDNSSSEQYTAKFQSFCY